MDEASVPPAAQRGAAAAASTAAAAAAVVAPPANDDPVLAMLYRMEQKIESPPTPQTAQQTTTRTTVDDREAPPPNNHAVHAGNDGDGGSHGGVAVEAAIMPLPSFPAAAAGAEAAAAGRGRKRPRHHQQQQQQQQQQHPPLNDGKPSFHNPKQATRINWSKSPHRERLSRILDEWFAPSGRALDDSTGRPVANYKVYAAKVGISPTTLWKYICPDPTKRRSIKDEGDEGSRGKKRLIDGAGIKSMVDELRGRMRDGENGGFARPEAVRLVMDRFGLTRAAASRQLTRHILPALAEDEAGRASTAGDGGRDHDFEEATQQQQRPMGRRRSIVIAGAASRMGRALFGYYQKLGHDVVGCVATADERVSLTTEMISQAQLTVVDIADDDAVRRWANILEEAGMEPDLIVVAAETCPENKHDVPAWEVPREDFDRTLNHNVSAVANVVQHFVPLLIRCHCHAVEGGGADDASGAFVALSSSLGRSPHPRRAAYAASKFAIEGLMKSVAASLPGPLCAVPLAPGAEVEPWQEESNKPNGSGEWSNAERDRWAHDAGRLILGLTRKDNGRSLSVKGRYSTKERQRWIIQDGTGVPGG